MDDNKIEITVELDTKNAEKEAKELNKKLVDGAKDATREFDKMKQSVSKNFNNIQKQVEKTFDGAKMASKMSTSVSKALDGIKSKINNVLGNINVNANLNANTSSSKNEGSNGSNMATSIATGGAIGAMLNKAQSLKDVVAKPFINALDVAKKISQVLENLNKIKINDSLFSTSSMSEAVYTFKQIYNDVNEETKSFGQAVDMLNDRLRDAQAELNETEVYADGLQSALYDVKAVMNYMGVSNNGLMIKGEEEKFERLQQIIKETEQVISQHLANKSIKVPIDASLLTNLKRLTNDLVNATQGANKFKLIVSNAMGTVGEAVYTLNQKISNKLGDSMFGKAFNSARKFGNNMRDAFAQGFNKPSEYIDRMKNKITEWANKHKQATDKVKSANKSVGGSFKSLLSQILPFASIYGIFNGLKNSITSFVDSQENLAKFNTVFGDLSDSAMDWADNLSGSVAVSKSSLMDGASNIMSIAKSMGMVGEEALGFTQNLSEMAVDLNSFNNIEDGLDRVRSGILGEYESLKSIGIVLSEDAVNARMLSMGLNDASNSSKMLARQSLIMEQMMASGALGNASREASGLSAQLKILHYNFQALGQAIGSCFAGLLQVVLPVLNTIVSAVTNAFNKLAGLINSIFGLFGVKVGASGASGGGAVGSAIGGITDGLGSGLDDAGSGAGKVADDLASGAESAKEIAKGLMGIDEIQTIGSPSDSGGGSGSGSSGAGGSGAGGLGDLGGLGSGLGETTSVLEEVNSELTKFQKGFLAIWEQLVDGFNRHKDAIISLWNELKDNLNALGQEMADFFVSAWQNGLDRTVNLIGGIVGAVVETALGIANSVVEVVTNLFNHLNPDNNENSKKFIDAINYLLEQIEGFITDAGKWFSQFATACQPFINNLGDIAMIVGGILAEVLADAIQLVRDFMNSWVGQAIIEGIAGALEWLSGVLESCLGFIQEHITFFEALTLGVLGAWGAFKLINGVMTIWNGLMTIFASIGAICSIVATILGGAIAFLTSPIGLVVLAIGALIAIGVLLYKNWDEVKAWCTKAWDAICKGIQDAGKIIATTFDYMKTTALNKCKEIWNNIKSIWESIKGYFSQVLNAIKNTISGVLDGIKTVFSGAWNVIKTGVSGAFNGIKNAISTVMNGIKSTISGVINGVKTVFSNGFDACKTTVSNVFNGIKTSISNIMNGAKDIVSGIINKIKGFFNFTVSLPHIKLPHFTIKPSGWKIGDLLKGSIPSLGISWYSDGGIFPNKRLIGVGDASKGIGNNAEAVIPLDRLWNELGKQFTKQNQTLNKGNNQPVNITLKLDGREISKATFKNFEELSRLGIIDLSTLI